MMSGTIVKGGKFDSKPNNNKQQKKGIKTIFSLHSKVFCVNLNSNLNIDGGGWIENNTVG